MSEIRFSDNYNDKSKESGVDAGFQFEFFCEHCNDTWRSPFVQYKRGQISGWLGKIGGLLGASAGTIGDTVGGLAESGYGQAHDEAFHKAIEQVKQHFHRCAKCSNYVCGRCWNSSKGLCRGCAPSAEVEIEAAKAMGEVQAASEAALQEGVKRGAKMDVTRDRQLSCPECGAETKGAKFCPSCGTKLAKKKFCPECGAQSNPDTKFCPECGTDINRK